MPTASMHRVVPMSSKKQAPVHSYRCNDETFSDTDTVDLMGEADAVLSVTPNESKAVDLSAYLVPDNEHDHSAVKATPASLETQDVALDQDSREVSDLLDYLNDLGFDSPRSLLEAHSHRQTPNPRDADPTTAAQVPLNRNTVMQTPAQRKVFRDRSNQTWPAGAKKILRSSDTPLTQSTTVEGTAEKRNASFFSPQTAMNSHRQKENDSLPAQECSGENGNDRSELELDMSLEQLLEETTDKMLSPRTTWQFSEEEWERLEKVQQMAEILLREAEHERESARRWARSVRESVQQWVEEQRALEEAHTHSSDIVQLKATREALIRLQLDMEEATLHHDAVKQKFMAVIQRQADTIKDLEAKLHDKAAATAPAFKSPKQSAMSGHTRTPISSMRASRISLSPTDGRMGRDKQVESNVPSPISNIDPITPTKHDALPNSVPSPVSMNVTPRTQRARTTLVDGGKLVVYRNGTEKETRPDGTCVIRFPNGDVKCTLGNEATVGIVAYYHAKEKTTHIRHRNGVEIYEYPNGQVERNFPDGRKDVRFPDGTKRKMLADGSKETVFPDGIRVSEDANGKREITTGKGADQ